MNFSDNTEKLPTLRRDNPSSAFLGRNLRTRLDLVCPEDTYRRVMEKQQAEFEASFRTFTPKQKVYFLTGNPRMDKWVPGTIVTRLGDLHTK